MAKKCGGVMVKILMRIIRWWFLSGDIHSPAPVWLVDGRKIEEDLVLVRRNLEEFAKALKNGR
jgi:hypothetical protein